MQTSTNNQAVMTSPGTVGRPFYTRLAALGFGLVTLGAAVYFAFALPGGNMGELVFILPIIAIALLIAGAVLRFGAWAQVLAAVLSLALLALVLPFSLFNLLHPESGGDFIPLLLLVVGAALGLVGSMAGLVQRRRHTLRVSATPAEAIALKGVLAAIALVSLGSLALTFGARTTVSAESRANAISIEIKSFDFHPNQLEARTGSTVRLVVKNSDPTLHTFTLPEAGVDVSVPPGSEKLVEFKAPAPGEYRWYCIPHSDPGPNGRTGMVGVLDVQ